jgi:hypothetical protein
VLYIRFNVRCAILFSVIGIIQVTIHCQPIVSGRNEFQSVINSGFDWMTVDSPNSADIQDLSSPSARFLADQAGGKGDHSDNLNAAATSC